MSDVVNVCIIAELDVVEVRIIVKEDLGMRKSACDETGNKARTDGDSHSDGHSSEVDISLLSGAKLVDFSKDYRTGCDSTQIVFRGCATDH